ncbi:MAG: ABC transporter permease [Alphaproteobacteria bacterium]
MWGRIAALVVKEMLAVWRDRRSQLAIVGPPLVQLFLFSYAATLDVTNVAIGVLNRDDGAWSREFVQRLEGSTTFTDIHVLRRQAEIDRLIDTRAVVAVLHFGPTFSADVAAGGPARVQVILDGRRSNATQIVQGYLETIAADLRAEIIRARDDAPPGRAEAIERGWFNVNLIFRWFTVPSLIGILAMLVALIVTGQSIARERELGTFDQLLVSPLRPHEILIGKTVPPLLIALVHSTVFLLAAVFVFEVPFRGSIALFYLALVLYLVATIGIGLFISALAQTQQQAFLGAFLFMAPAVLLSGFAAPVENMPEWLQIGTLANPLRHFVVLSKGLFLKALPPGEVAANALPLVVIAAVTLPVAAWLFTRRLE